MQGFMLPIGCAAVALLIYYVVLLVKGDKQ